MGKLVDQDRRFLLPLPWEMVGERCKNWKCEDGKMGRSGEAVSSPSPLGEGRGEASYPEKASVLSSPNRGI
jgi:hypothetical protein